MDAIAEPLSVLGPWTRLRDRYYAQRTAWAQRSLTGLVRLIAYPVGFQVWAPVVFLQVHCFDCGIYQSSKLPASNLTILRDISLGPRPYPWAQSKVLSLFLHYILETSALWGSFPEASCSGQGSISPPVAPGYGLASWQAKLCPFAWI